LAWTLGLGWIEAMNKLSFPFIEEEIRAPEDSSITVTHHFPFKSCGRTCRRGVSVRTVCFSAALQ
jgi:hypothetical protein